MGRKTRIALPLAALIALTAATPAMSTTHGMNGLIVYTQELSPDHFQLFTIHPDGSGAKQITHAVNAGNPGLVAERQEDRGRDASARRAAASG